MGNTEQERHELYTDLSNAIGAPSAERLMRMLPTEEYATRAEFYQELGRLENSIKDSINQRIDRLMLAWVAGFVALMAASVFG